MVRLQCHVDCGREEVDRGTLLGFTGYLLQVVKICAELPRCKNGKIKIDHFMKLPILSEEAFNAIDKNRDGFITKGELKLANKKTSMGAIGQVTWICGFYKHFSPPEDRGP